MDTNTILKKENIPFTQVPNVIIYDEKLSAQAKGVACYLFSRPDGWHFNYIEIASHFKNSEDTIRKLLKELEKAGYLTREKIREGGKFARVEYRLSFTNLVKTNLVKTKTGKTKTGKTEFGFLGTNNIEYSNTESNNIDNNNTPYISKDIYPPKGESQPKKNIFKAPTIEEVEAYGKSKGFTKTDYVDFWEFYENKGWKIGNVKMKSWQLALHRWERNQKGKTGYGIDNRYTAKDTSNNNGSCNSSADYSDIEFRDLD